MHPSPAAVMRLLQCHGLSAGKLQKLGPRMAVHGGTPSNRIGSARADPMRSDRWLSTAGSADAAVKASSERLQRFLQHNNSFIEKEGFLPHRPGAVNTPVAGGGEVAKGTGAATAPKAPATRAVVVTCMDTRLTNLLEAATGLKAGDAKIIKTAGAIINQPFGGIMRSVIVALYELNCDEVFVIGHHDCGMANLNTPNTIKKMIDRGCSPRTIQTLQYSGVDLNKWLHGFDSVAESVKSSVEIITHHPLVPDWVPVHGLIIHPVTGKLDLVIDGSDAQAARSTKYQAADSKDLVAKEKSKMFAPQFTPPPVSPIV